MVIFRCYVKFPKGDTSTRVATMILMMITNIFPVQTLLILQCRFSCCAIMRWTFLPGCRGQVNLAGGAACRDPGILTRRLAEGCPKTPEIASHQSPSKQKHSTFLEGNRGAQHSWCKHDLADPCDCFLWSFLMVVMLRSPAPSISTKARSWLLPNNESLGPKWEQLAACHRETWENKSFFFALQLASSKSNPSSTNEGTMDPTCVPPPNHHLHVPRNELEPVMKLQLYKNKVCGCSWIELLITVETIKFVVPINGSYALLIFVKFRVSCRVTKGLCRMRFRSSSHLQGWNAP